MKLFFCTISFFILLTTIYGDDAADTKRMRKDTTSKSWIPSNLSETVKSVKNSAVQAKDTIVNAAYDVWEWIMSTPRKTSSPPPIISPATPPLSEVEKRLQSLAHGD